MNVNGISNTNMQMGMGVSNVMRDNANTDFATVLENAVENGVEAGQDTSEIRRAAVEMESFFINQMFQALRRTIPESEGLFEKSNAEKIFQEMLDETTAQNLAESGGLGIADMMYEQLTRQSR